ncbi:nucleotidyltransferase domain-containing protein [Deinococcus sp.]|uniref:nucleotidyltransferase domain-containing protein n=1 Tax=Deinococcus sp. TaxID=47478 RepID=UPI003CC53998
MTFPQPLYDAVSTHRYPLVFATISGAHLYGFASPDSDWDLRGVHVLPAAEVLGLHEAQDTVNVDRLEDGLELDLVTHDIRKFIELMLKPNGYVLEQLFSPLVVHTTPAHSELIDLGRQCIRRYHAHHYLGFSANQWKLLHRDEPPRIKPLLYTFRTLLTGIRLMKTGEIEANLTALNAEANLSYLTDLIARKTVGSEKERLTDDLTFFDKEFKRLTRMLENAFEATNLPDRVPDVVRNALSDFLVRLRMNS